MLFRPRQRTRIGLVAAALVCAAFAASVLGGSAASAGAGTLEPDYGAAAAGCNVTEPDSTTAPGVTYPPDFEPPEEPQFISSEGLFVSFGELSTVAVPPGGHPAPGTTLGVPYRGKIWSKIMWRRDRRAWGNLRVRAISRPEGEEARTRYSNHLGPRNEFIPGGFVWPHEGCWRVTGKAGGATLRATVWVVSLRDR